MVFLTVSPSGIIHSLSPLEPVRTLQIRVALARPLCSLQLGGDPQRRQRGKAGAQKPPWPSLGIAYSAYRASARRGSQAGELRGGPTSQVL